MTDVTQILSAIEQDDPSAAAKLLPLVYEELRELAAAKMAREAAKRPGRPRSCRRVFPFLCVLVFLSWSFYPEFIWISLVLVGKHVGWVLAPTRSMQRSRFLCVRASTHPTDRLSESFYPEFVWISLVFQV